MTIASNRSRGSTPEGQPKKRTENPAPMPKGGSTQPSDHKAPGAKPPHPAPATKRAPHYDDRPSHQRGGSESVRESPNPRIPEYGDTQPQDPRRVDLDARERTDDPSA